MTGRWVNKEAIASRDVFEALHLRLTVKLISTGRNDLMTCDPGESLSAVMERNREPYDYFPVVETGTSGEDRIPLRYRTSGNRFGFCVV